MEKLPYSADTVKAILGFLLIVLEYWTFRGWFVMGARKKYLSAENLKTFEKDHHTALPDQPKIHDLGYPDTGNGRYVKGLGFETWYHFNNAMRTEVNFQEQITFILLAT